MSWTGPKYALFRLSLGFYLCVHLLALLPWGVEVFSERGVLPDPAASPLSFLFPNALAFHDSPEFVTVLLASGAAASALLAVGLGDRAAALLLWYVWACLFGRNPLIGNPSMPFIGWILLAHALTPPLPPVWSHRRPDFRAWRMPPDIHRAGWVVMALAYSYSGLTKLGSPSWFDGAAVAHVLANPLARLGPARDFLLALPLPLLAAVTWAVLGLELFFAPLALIRRLRPWLWTAMLALHLGLLTVMNFTDLTLGMVVVHFYAFDPAWIRHPVLHPLTARNHAWPALCASPDAMNPRQPRVPVK